MDESGAESTEELHFFYDAQSRPAFVEYNGVKYRYVYNLQGDIVGIVDSADNLVVEYRYDAWGKPLSITGTLKTSLGELNPFGYRGYVYDKESTLYYLQSRFYMPEIGRFLNLDGLFVTSVLGNNLFCYCWNNSSNHVDSAGTFALAVLVAIGIGAVVEGLKNAAVSVASDLIVHEKVNLKDAVKEFLKGAIIGAVGACFAGVPWRRVIDTGTSIIVNVIAYLRECKEERKEVSSEVIVWEVTAAVAGGILGAGLAGGAEAANKTVDKIVTEAAEAGISIATSSVGKHMQEPEVADSGTPHYKRVYDPLLGKYREIVIYS